MTRRGRRVAWLAAAGVALLGVLATGLVLFLRGEDGPPEAWRVPDEGNPSRTLLDEALWVSGSVVTRVVRSDTGVVGYDTDDGSRLWQAPTPEGAGHPCRASDRTNADGVGAVLYTTGGSGCSMLGVVDTHDGALLWSRDLGFLIDPPDDLNIVVNDETVVVSVFEANGPNGFFLLDLATGAILRVPTSATDNEAECADEPDRIAAAESRLVTLTTCLEEDRQVLSVYDADTEELLWFRSVEEFEMYGIVGTDPLIVRSTPYLVAYSDTGDELWRLDQTGIEEEQPLAPRAVAGDVLVTESLLEYGAPSGVFAGYDTETGERLWRNRAGEGWSFYGQDDDGLLLFAECYFDPDTSSDRLHLSWTDPADGSEQRAETVDFPWRDGEIEMIVAFGTDRLYITGSVDPDMRLRAFDL